MKLRQFLSSFVVALFIASTSAFSRADDLESLAPFINEHTLAVVSLDLTQLDPAALQKQYFDPLVRTDAERIAASVAVGQAQEWIERLRADGVRNVYLVLTAARLSQISLATCAEDLATSTPFLIVPGVKAETLKDLQTKFDPLNKQMRQARATSPTLKSGEIHGVGVVAFDALFDLLAKQKPQSRPEFATALEAAGDRPVRFALVPPPLFARAAEEILLDPLPDTKQPLGPIVARGAKWVSVGIEPNLDRFSAQLIIQSADAQAAKDLADTLHRATVLAGSKLAEEGKYQGMIGTALLTTLLPIADGDRLILSLDQERAAGLRQFLSGALQLARAGTERHTSMNNLKQIALAMHNNHSARKQFPDRAIRDKDGKPLLSWRVAILPYLEGNKLYQEFHLDEPWDSEHNRKLIEKMPAVYADPYRSPDTDSLAPGYTRYLAPVGEKLAFPPDRGTAVKDFTDGTSQTILIVEADLDHAVIWTKPDDLEIDLNDPKRGLTDGKKSFNAVRADGSAHVVPGNIETETLRSLFTRNGGEPVNE